MWSRVYRSCPIRKWHNFRTVKFHMYTIIDGNKVDVSLDPLREEMYCKNSEKRLCLPVNVSRVKRVLSCFSHPSEQKRNAY